MRVPDDVGVLASNAFTSAMQASAVTVLSETVH